MSEKNKIARPYAKAVFEFALSKGDAALTHWSTVLSRLARAVSDPTLMAVILNPRITSQAKSALLLALSQTGEDSATANFIALVARNKRFVMLPEIAALYEHYKSLHLSTVEVELISARPIAKDYQAKFQSVLEKRLNKKVTCQYLIDTALLGGAIVRAGDFVIDGSLRGRISRLSETLVG